jgi:glycine cleavage system H lipoate-binding protein/ABC-type phosphate transport system substrate-binding protein
MKTYIFMFVCLFMHFFGVLTPNKAVAQEKTNTENTIKILCTPDLYNLTNNWATEFCELNPDIKIKLIKYSDSKISNIYNAGAEINFVSNEAYAILNNNNLWKMQVGKDALIPIINSKNPFLSEIKKQNISPVILSQILLSPNSRKWNIVPKIRQNAPINYYLVNDRTTDLMIARFLSTNQTIEGIKVENNDKMIAAIQNDPYAIGFCKLSNLLNSSNPDAYKDIIIMPLDKNSNGKIDDFENTYPDLQTFIRKAWIGKYPNELTENIYSIADQTPTNKAGLAFLGWISTDGQKLLNDNGYSALVSAEKQSNLDMLGLNKVTTAISDDSSFIAKIALFFASISKTQYGFALFIILLLLVIRLMTFTPKNKTITSAKGSSAKVFEEDSILVPAALFFDKTHTWTFMEKTGKVRMGIDDFILHITGPLTKVKMKNPGEQVKKGEPILSIIQNGKLLNINSPVSGTILEQNEILASNPSLVNQSPLSDGWIYMIEPVNWLREIQFFTMAEKYKEWIKNEFSRLKDFLSVTINSKMPEYAQVVLQDGGTIKDHVLTDLGPEIWEEFQVNFIDTMK